MKKLLIAAFLCSSFTWGAAFNSTMQWDLRTTGTDLNSGGYDPGVASPGTNEALQDNGTAVTCAVTTVTATCVPAITSTTHGPGNTIIFASGAGCSLVTVEILSQAAGTATFNVTGGTGTCVGVLGGGKLTPQAILALATNSNTVNFKSGTISVTTLTSYVALSIKTLCYSSSWGDHGTGCVWTTATNNIHTVEINGGNDQAWYTFENISFTNTAGTRTSSIGLDNESGASMFVIGGTFSGFTGTSGYAMGQHASNLLVIGSEFTNNYVSLSSNNFGSYPATIIGANFHDNVLTGTGAGILVDAGSVHVFGTLFTNNNRGLQKNNINGEFIVSGNTFASNVNGIFVTVNGPGFLNQCNIYYNNSTAGVGGTATGANAQLSRQNAYGSNGANYPTYLVAGVGDITGISNPFTNSAGNDWSLGTAGAALKGACTQSFLGSSTSTGLSNIGAWQASTGATAPQSTVYGQ